MNDILVLPLFGSSFKQWGVWKTFGNVFHFRHVIACITYRTTPAIVECAFSRIFLVDRYYSFPREILTIDL